MRCGVTTSYLCYINLTDGIEIFSSKNPGILIFRPRLIAKIDVNCNQKGGVGFR